MLEEKLKTIPHLPGSYQMRNKNNVIIYVGKAKDLKKRVNSYFKGNVYGKTEKLVSEIADFTYITTATEQEAFILELNLIKQYNPKYNIYLKMIKHILILNILENLIPDLKYQDIHQLRKKIKRYYLGLILMSMRPEE